MSMYAILTAASIVKAVAVFYGSSDWPAEPQDETAAVMLIQQWNNATGNPLGMSPGEFLLRTDATGARGHRASIGDKWEPDLGLFVAPQPFPSWTLDVATDTWVPPTPMPLDGKLYRWDEEQMKWVQL